MEPSSLFERWTPEDDPFQDAEDWQEDQDLYEGLKEFHDQEWGSAQ